MENIQTYNTKSYFIVILQDMFPLTEQKDPCGRFRTVRGNNPGFFLNLQSIVQIAE